MWSSCPVKFKAKVVNCLWGAEPFVLECLGKIPGEQLTHSVVDFWTLMLRPLTPVYLSYRARIRFICSACVRKSGDRLSSAKIIRPTAMPSRVIYISSGNLLVVSLFSDSERSIWAQILRLKGFSFLFPFHEVIWMFQWFRAVGYCGVSKIFF